MKLMLSILLVLYVVSAVCFAEIVKPPDNKKKLLT